MTLEEIEARIEATYQWFHAEAPGVKPRLVGELGALWDAFWALEPEDV